jgi:hypothetical protein
VELGFEFSRATGTATARRHFVQSGSGCPYRCCCGRRGLTPFACSKEGWNCLEIKEIKNFPDVPLSHPFIERLIGTIRRECLDQTLFWTMADLEAKLRASPWA